MGEENEEMTAEQHRAEFDAIPASHTFLEIKMFLTDCHEGELRPTGQLFYHGDRLKALGVDRLIGAECRTIHSLAHNALQTVLNRAGQYRVMAEMLGFGGEDDESDGKGSDTSGEQSASSASGHD